jgi:hypothetical protein
MNAERKAPRPRRRNPRTGAHPQRPRQLSPRPEPGRDRPDVANRPTPHAHRAARNFERLCSGKQENLRTTSDATKGKMTRVQHSGTDPFRWRCKFPTPPQWGPIPSRRHWKTQREFRASPLLMTAVAGSS